MIRRLVPYSLYPGFPELDPVGQESYPVAVGGDLTIERILIAYKQGIYPMFLDDQQIVWWSPDPRTVLFPEQFKLSRSLARSIRNRGYSVTVDQEFEATIRNCASVVRAQDDVAITWITEGMIEAYCELHRLGFAHSIETWRGSELVGGLYGLSIGKVFFGESMYSVERDASKVALSRLVQHLHRKKFVMIDCQDPTPLLLSLGAEKIPRSRFLDILEGAVREQCSVKIWKQF